MSAEVELGWTTITPCSRVDWVDSSIPGVKVPVVRTAEQRLYAFAVIDSDNMREEAHQAVKDCALAAVGAAGGVGAITANPGTAVGAFKAAFLTCFAAKFADIAINNVRLETRAQCMW